MAAISDLPPSAEFYEIQGIRCQRFSEFLHIRRILPVFFAAGIVMPAVIAVETIEFVRP
jgi:hypothetical protein